MTNAELEFILKVLKEAKQVAINELSLTEAAVQVAQVEQAITIVEQALNQVN